MKQCLLATPHYRWSRSLGWSTGLWIFPFSDFFWSGVVWGTYHFKLPQSCHFHNCLSQISNPWIIAHVSQFFQQLRSAVVGRSQSELCRRDEDEEVDEMLAAVQVWCKMTYREIYLETSWQVYQPPQIDSLRRDLQVQRVVGHFQQDQLPSSIWNKKSALP